MTKVTFIVVLFVLALTSYGQTPSVTKNKPMTSRYGGTYSYGDDVEKTRVGSIIIYPESDSTILFYLDLNRGGPSYNMGSERGRIKLINGTGTFYTKESDQDIGCKWIIQFIENTVVITTIDNQDNCGFGYGVFTDGTYVQRSKIVPDYFENQEGMNIYFKDIK